MKRYRTGNTLGVGNVGLGGGWRAGRIAYGDAIFLGTEAALITRGDQLAGTQDLTVSIEFGGPDLASCDCARQVRSTGFVPRTTAFS